ncbi:hypothetical protein BYT27DRAFT_6441831 [Phlegmacium glaucopus]|nr:hypothetical protein BYT27DRAFT_6441831 [Phlegmacium glaucopus]
MSADAVIDCTAHTVESASLLYTDSFYSDVLRVLRPGGRFSQQMNTKDKRFETFQKQAKECWLKFGFADVMEWQEYTVSYGGIAVIMGGQICLASQATRIRLSSTIDQAYTGGTGGLPSAE